MAGAPATQGPANRAVISLGSNLGDRMALLSAAVRTLGRSVRTASSVFSTPPWGGVEQDDFYNAVVLLEDTTVHDRYEWLRRCQALEADAGRERALRWGPRTLDADVVTVGELVQSDPELILPHPRAHERAFVLVPWAEIDPGAELPGYGPIADLLEGLDRSGISRIGRLR